MTLRLLCKFFCLVVNISWPKGRAPENFREVLTNVSRQMDEQIVKERLEETISYNVSNEKKWYVRAIPLFIKHLAMELIFLRTSRCPYDDLFQHRPCKDPGRSERGC